MKIFDSPKKMHSFRVGSDAQSSCIEPRGLRSVVPKESAHMSVYMRVYTVTCVLVTSTFYGTETVKKHNDDTIVFMWRQAC